MQPNIHFTADNQRAVDFEDALAKTEDLSIKAMRTLLLSNGILTPERKLDRRTVDRLRWKLEER